MTTVHQIYNHNSNNMEMIPDQSVQLVVTSPPYPMIEMWDEMFFEQDKTIRDDFQNNQYNSAFEKMHGVLDNIWKECDRVLCDNGFICINIGDATRTLNDNFQLYPNHARIINTFLKMGYCVLPDIHWRKPSNAPNKFMGSGMYPAGAYVTYEHEYILVFRKGGKRIFKGEAKKYRQESAYFWEERNVWFSDLWEINGTSQLIKLFASRTRNASYPFEIPYRLVNMYSAKNDTVLDPFGGFATTALACMASQRNSISIEIDPSIYELAQETMNIPYADLNKIIEKRLVNHQNFIDNLDTNKREKCYQNNSHGFLVKTRQEVELSLKYLSDKSRIGNNVLCTYE